MSPPPSTVYWYFSTLSCLKINFHLIDNSSCIQKRKGYSDEYKTMVKSPTYLLIGKTMSWKTCFVNVNALTKGVVVNFINAGLGGSIQPRKNKNNGWFPKGIMDSSTQKMALSWRNKYSLWIEWVLSLKVVYPGFFK